MENRACPPVIKIRMPLVLALVNIFVWNISFPAHSQLPPPSQVWLSLGYSTSDQRPPDWQWLEKQVQQGRIIEAIQPARDKVRALIIPVFDDGQCFYETQVKPFAGRNQNAPLNEVALRKLFQAAHKAGVPIYLGLDVLGWHKRSAEITERQATNIFDVVPSWQENGKTPGNSTEQTAYASPFHPQVRAVMTLLILELAMKFPEADGIVLNLRLSDQEIMGYSSTARREAQAEMGLDPIDLNLQGTAEETLKEDARRWVQWRNEQTTTFLQSLVDAYHQVRPSSQVLASGMTDYYKSKEFNDLRRTQDWRQWLKSGIVDGVLIEGHWQPRYVNDRYYANFLEDSAELSTLNDKKILLIPVSLSERKADGGNYGSDWANLKTRVPVLGEMAFVVGSDQDLQSAIAVASGKVPLLRFGIPQVGEVLPDFFLNDSSGQTWEPRNEDGKNGFILLVGEKAMALATKHSVLKRWQQAGVETIVASSHAPAEPSMKFLLDKRRELTAWFPNGNGAVLVDRAGFTRGLGTIEVMNLPDFLQNPHALASEIKEGQDAPDFALPDMNGNIIRLSSFKGKKNVLITFFPRCFTGGCKQHLASLQANESILEGNDLAIIAVSVDPPNLQRDFAKILGARFPLIPDVGRNLSLLYGATENTTDLASRMSVLIDKSGTVRWIEKNITVATHGADVLSKMRELKIGK